MTDASPISATLTRPRAAAAAAAARWLAEPVAAQSLAVFRIAFGALLLWDCLRFLHHDRIDRYWVEPAMHFPSPFFGWVVPLPAPWIHLAWIAMGVAAALVALGLFYRGAIVALTLLFTYFFLLDAAEYLNHFYLVILFAILLCVLPAHRVWSLDARRHPGREETVPRAAVFVLKAQMEIVLIFAGLVKITPDWLAGEPLGLWLRDRGGLFAPLFAMDWAVIAAAWGTIALHVVGAPLLLWRRTRLAVFLLYGAFHVANAYHFNIGIFPWLAIAASTIFFAPDWPARLLARLRRAAPPVAPPPGDRPALPALALAGLALWLAVQVALPLRANLFDGEVRWTGDGHRFSWRMRIYDRVAEGRFIVTAADGTEWIVDPDDWLTERQADKMLVRADLIHAFAARLESAWAEAGHGDVAVRAEIMKSLNGRPFQPYIDPTVDLTAVPFGLWAADPWVMPLILPVRGVADNG